MWTFTKRPTYAGYLTGSGYWKTCHRRDAGHDIDQQPSYECSCQRVDSANDPLGFRHKTEPTPNTAQLEPQQRLVSSSQLEHEFVHDSSVTCLNVGRVFDNNTRREEIWIAVGLKTGALTVWSLGDTALPVYTIDGCHSGEVTVLCWWSGGQASGDHRATTAVSEDDRESVYDTSDYDFTSGNFGQDNTCDDENPADDWVLVCDSIPKYRSLNSVSPSITPTSAGLVNFSSRSLKHRAKFRVSASRPHYLLTGGVDGRVTVVDCVIGCTVSNWLLREPIACASWDGRTALVGGQSGDIIVRDMAADVTICRVMAHPGERPISAISF